MTSGRVTIDNVGYKLLSGNRLHLLNTIGDVQLKDKDGDIVPVDEEFYVTLQDGEAYFIVEKSKRLSVDSTERKKVLSKLFSSFFLFLIFLIKLPKLKY